MADNPLLNIDEEKVDHLIENGSAPPEATSFSAEAHRDQFLSGLASENRNPTPTQDLKAKPDTVPARPGVPLVQRPLEINGVFYDPLHPPRAYQKADRSMEYRGGKPLEREEADRLYSERFWQRQPKGVREAMIENIQKGAESGFIGSYVDPGGITDDDREKLSAYRNLAKELGYEVGEYKFESNSHMARAPIRKLVH